MQSNFIEDMDILEGNNIKRGRDEDSKTRIESKRLTGLLTRWGNS